MVLVAASRSRSTRRLHRNPRADCAGRPSPQSQSREWWEGKQTQTRPSCRQAESLSTGRRCLVLKTLARPKRVPPAPRPWRSAVTRAKTCAPSTTSPEPPGPRRVRPAPRPRGRAFSPIECTEHKSGGHPVSGACPQAPRRPRRRTPWKCNNYFPNSTEGFRTSYFRLF